MRNNLERIYFYWSFGFLIVRTVCLCLFGGKVNDESTQPMLVLNSVSSDVYNLEASNKLKKYVSQGIKKFGTYFYNFK